MTTSPTAANSGVAKEDLALIGGSLVSVASSFAGGPAWLTEVSLILGLVGKAILGYINVT